MKPRPRTPSPDRSRLVAIVLACALLGLVVGMMLDLGTHARATTGASIAVLAYITLWAIFIRR